LCPGLPWRIADLAIGCVIDTTGSAWKAFGAPQQRISHRYAALSKVWSRDSETRRVKARDRPAWIAITGLLRVSLLMLLLAALRVQRVEISYGE
jgi:hypothetical protein